VLIKMPLNSGQDRCSFGERTPSIRSGHAAAAPAIAMASNELALGHSNGAIKAPLTPLSNDAKVTARRRVSVRAPSIGTGGSVGAPRNARAQRSTNEARIRVVDQRMEIVASRVARSISFERRAR
jgi:hypothetical protein